MYTNKDVTTPMEKKMKRNNRRTEMLRTPHYTGYHRRNKREEISIS